MAGMPEKTGFMKRINFVLGTLLALFLSQGRVYAQIFPVTQSVLSDGSIFRFGINKTGIQKLTKKMLDDAGVNTTTLNPKEIKIYGNYGGTLPEAILQSYPDDLIEIPLLINGEDDGKMNDADVIYFYAEAADTWKYEANSKTYIFDKNIYADKNYVYLKVSQGNGKRVSTENITDNLVEFETATQTVWDIFTEDKTNMLGSNAATIGSGKLWVGEYLVNNQEKDLSKLFDLKNRVAGTPVDVLVHAYGRSDKEGRFTLSMDGQSFTATTSAVSLGNAEAIFARQGIIQKSVSIATNSPKFTLKYSTAGNGDAWLDFVQVKSTQNINPGNNQLLVSHPGFSTSAYSKVIIGGDFAGGLAWMVSDPANVSGYTIKDGSVNFVSGKEDVRLVLFTTNAAYTPDTGSKLTNQNLHGLPESDLIIVYHPDFANAAQKLADHRIKHNGYKVSLADVSQIYQEFGSGRQDPSAIRNFAKMVLDRYPNFRYLLLLGDGSYDYKKLMPSVPYQNYIPAYETDESLNPINAFPTDDYYALLSNNEGANLKGALDIRVGRLTVSTAEEADQVVDKIIRYDVSPERFGEWKLKTGFCADDEDGNLHVNDADTIAKEAFEKDPLINQQKVYLDAYRQENTPGGERYNEATSAINQQMDQGQLAWCYLGHGGPKGLAQERVVKLSDIQGWSNSDKLTLLITATCSFSGYDDPSVASGGELALLNAKGGAIGLLTTTRPVYADKNKRLTSNVFKNLYARENGKALSFGEIILRAKNGTSLDTLEDNTRKFTLLGDPSQILALPEHDVVVTTINDQDATIYADTVGALDKIKLGGEIRDYTGALLSGFSGEVFVTLFDKATELKTLGNDEDSYEKSFNQYRNIIFKGRASAVNGKFEIEFILPKDINYQLGNGRISIYAHNALTDAAGHYDRLTIGGSSNTAVNDDEAPEMALFMNDEEFVFGGITDANPKLLIKLADDNGINITGNSIGHDITARITGPDFDEEVILNEYYTAAANNYKQGEVRYPLSKLAPGVYKVTAKAWDIANNSVEGETEFRVVETRNEKLHRVYNYPNPFTDNTEFSFEHDLAGLDVEIELKIYTINGRLVKSVSERRIAEGYRISMFEWDTREDYGSNLASGVYVYQITMTAPNEGLRRDSGYQKMVKI